VTDLLPAIAVYAATAALLTVTPGPDTALVLRSAVRAGRRTAAVTGLGVASGLLLWGAMTAVGLAALVAASPLGYEVLSMAGAAWLVVLGVRALWSARRVAAAESPHGETGPAGEDGSARLWRSFSMGLSTNLLNPKALVFYVSLLPQFIPAGAPVFGLTLLFAAIHAAQNVVWFMLISWTVTRVRAVMGRGAVRAWIDRVSGVVLVGFGIRVAASAG
jgi:threonine/homoserine/homoserine lactone efflux protein